MKTKSVALIVVVLCMPFVVEGQQTADTSRYGIAPVYEVEVELSVRVPMRDGATLPTEIYLPPLCEPGICGRSAGHARDVGIRGRLRGRPGQP